MLEPDFFFFHGAFISKLIPGETFYERKNYKYCTIEYVFHGRGVLKENGFCRQLGKDSIYFLHKYGDHRCENDPHDPWRKIFVMLDGSLMENLIDGYGLKSVYAIENAQELKHFFTEFLYLERHAAGIITDSGNVAEEATFLGVPCITLSGYTEHKETVNTGSNELGCDDPALIGELTGRMVEGKWKKSSIPERWDGHTADRIVCILAGEADE